MKKCVSCGVEKDVSLFPYRSKKQGTYRGQCKDCYYGGISKRIQSMSEEERQEFWRKKNERPGAAEQRQEWYERNKSKRAVSIRAWRERNPEKWAAAQRRGSAKRRALKQNASLGLFLEAEELWSLYGDQCIVPGCGYAVDDSNYRTADHIVPISRGGAHAWWNEQPMCRRHNSQKHARHSEDYRTHIFIIPNAPDSVRQDIERLHEAGVPVYTPLPRTA